MDCIYSHNSVYSIQILCILNMRDMHCVQGKDKAFMALPYSTIRMNPFTGRKVYISPSRQNRGAPKTVRALHREVTRDVFADPEANGEVPVWRHPQEGVWKMMVLPNLFPSLSHEFDEIPSPVEGGEFLPGYETTVGLGFQDLLIANHPTHTFADFSLNEILLMLQALGVRMSEIKNMDEKIAHFSIFQNYGAQAGETVPHPHIQMYALQHTPAEVSRRQQRLTDQPDLVNELIRSAREQNLMVYENDSWAVVVSPTPELDYEMHILPRDLRMNSFVDSMTYGGADVIGLADALGFTMRCVRLGLDDPPYNILFRLPSMQDDRHLHLPWYIDVRPAINYAPFGHKQITGDDIVSVDPSDAADLFLRHRDDALATMPF